MVREIPISVLFTFPKPNYVNPVTRGPALIIINAVFISLCTIVLFLRLYTRIFIKRWFGSDDIFIILAYISTVALTVNVIIANVHFYWDRHVWDIPISSIPGVLKVAFSAKLIFVFAATFTRQSLLCFYYRLIADSGMKWFDWALHATVFFNTTAAIVFACLGIWLCVPINAYWAISPPEGAHCLDEGRVVLAIGIVNCFIDLLITALPIPIITRLQMPLQQRIGVMILLSLGFVVVVAGAIRTYYIWKGLVVSYDETWFTYPLWIAAAVEINLGVICACMPALRPFISRYITPAFSNFSSRISSFISRGSLSSTRQSSSSRGASSTNRSSNPYRKFSNSNNSSTGKGSVGGTTLRGGSSKLSSKMSSRFGGSSSKYGYTTETTTIDANTSNNNDELFFITSPIEMHDRITTTTTTTTNVSPTPSTRSSSSVPRGGGRNMTALPQIITNTTSLPPPPPPPPGSSSSAHRLHLPAVQPHSPLEITCRHSFEIVSLDRGGGGDNDSANPSHTGRASSTFDRLGEGGGGQGGGEGATVVPLELDPREREWRVEVSCPRGDDEGEKKKKGSEAQGAGKKRVRRKRSFIMGRGWGRF